MKHVIILLLFHTFLFAAEYGDALSGGINIVTEEGDSRLSGNIRHLTEEMFSGDILNYGCNLYELLP